jgi:hypothetical protein
MRFGQTLRRIMTQIVRANPAFGPVKLGKYDLADGYYRIQMNAKQAMKPAFVLPPAHGDEQLMAIPLVLPMGWTESAPYFCATTEAVVDLINATIPTKATSTLPPRRLEQLITYSNGPGHIPTPNTPRQLHGQFYDRPLANSEVYMDDIIGLYQPAAMPELTFIHHIFHNIDRIFHPLDPTDPPYRIEPISTSKLLKGDGNLFTRKVIFGWILDTATYTL